MLQTSLSFTLLVRVEKKSRRAVCFKEKIIRENKGKLCKSCVFKLNYFFLRERQE